MKRKAYNLTYAAVMVSVIVLLLAIPTMNDMVQMLLGGSAMILTSIFTYSNRRAFSRSRSPKDHT